jgi:hypothetical protein
VQKVLKLRLWRFNLTVMTTHNHTAPRTSQPSPGDGLYLAVRAAFVAKGTSLNR